MIPIVIGIGFALWVEKGEFEHMHNKSIPAVAVGLVLVLLVLAGVSFFTPFLGRARLGPMAGRCASVPNGRKCGILPNR